MDVDGQRNDTGHDSADQKTTRDAGVGGHSFDERGAERGEEDEKVHCRTALQCTEGGTAAHDGRRHASRADSIGMLWGEQTRTRSGEGGDDCKAGTLQNGGRGVTVEPGSDLKWRVQGAVEVPIRVACPRRH
jgi:hypothetical protein